MNDIVIGVKIVGDAKGLVGEVRLSRQEILGLARDTAESSESIKKGREATEQLAQQIKGLSETLGQNKRSQQEYRDALKSQKEEQDKSKTSLQGMATEILKGVTGVEILRRAWDRAVETFREVVLVTRDMQESQARIQSILRATGGASGQTVESVDRLVESMERLTKFDDASLRNASATVLTFGKDVDGVFERVLQLSADLAASGRGDVESWSFIISKALKQPADTLPLLERALGKFDQSLKVSIENALFYNDTAKARLLILDAIASKVGGTAADGYRGLTRQIEGTKKAWEDLEKAMGGMIFDANSRDASTLEKTLRSITEFLKSNEPTMEKWAKFLLIAANPAAGGAALASVLAGGDSRSGPNFARGAIKPAPPEATSNGVPRQLSDAALQRLQEDRLQRDQQFQERLYQMQANEIARELALEDQRHQAGLTSDTAYFARKEQLQEQNIRNHLIALDKEIADQSQLVKIAKDQVLREVGKEDFDPQAIETATRKRDDAIERGSALTLQRKDAEKALAAEIKKRGQLQYDADSKTIDRLDAIAKDQGDYERALADQTSEMQKQVELVGKDEVSISKANNERKLALQYEEKRLAILKKIGELPLLGSDEDRARLVQEIDELGAATRRAIESQGKAIENVFNAQQFKRIGDELADAILDGGKGGVKRLIKILEDEFKKLVLRPIIAPIMQGIAGAVGGAAGVNPAQSAAGNMGGSLLGSWLSSGANTAAGWMGYSGLGTVGEAWGAASGAIPSAAIGADAVAAGVGTDTLAAGIGEALAAIPVWGWIIAALIAVAAYLGSMGGGPKQQGAYAGSFGTSGEFLGDLSNGPEMVNITGDNQARDAARQSVIAIGRGYAQELARLGGTSAGLQFGLGFSRDPAGDAPSFVHTAVRDAQGRDIFSQRNDDVGRDPKDIQAEIQLQGQRAILAALQASELPDAIHHWLNSLDASTATAEQIARIMRGAEALSTIIADAANIDAALEDLSNGGLTSIRQQLHQLDSAVESSQNAFRAAMAGDDPEAVMNAERQLTAVVLQRYQAEIAMVRQLQEQIDGLKQELYDFSLGIMQRIAAAGGSVNIAGFSLSHANDLRSQVGGDSNPARQLRFVQQYVGSIDTWYQTRKAAIMKDIEAQNAANQAAAEAQRAAYQARISAANQELQIAQQWAGVLEHAQQMLDQMRLTGVNPLATSGRYALAQGDSAIAEAAYGSATGGARAGAANKYLDALSRELGLLGELYQRPSPEYEAGYNAIISRITKVQGEAKTQADRMEDLQQQMVSLQSAANNIASVALVTSSSQLEELNQQYIEQLTWAQSEGERLYNLQIHQHEEQLMAITGGMDVELFIAARQAEAVTLLQGIRDDLRTYLASVGLPSNGAPGTTGTGTTGNPADRGDTFHFHFSGTGRELNTEDVLKALAPAIPRVKRLLVTNG